MADALAALISLLSGVAILALLIAQFSRANTALDQRRKRPDFIAAAGIRAQQGEAVDITALLAAEDARLSALERRTTALWLLTFLAIIFLAGVIMRVNS